jgi:hypothetical protein
MWAAIDRGSSLFCMNDFVSMIRSLKERNLNVDEATQTPVDDVS